jgi:hypothetical protein
MAAAREQYRERVRAVFELRERARVGAVSRPTPRELRRAEARLAQAMTALADAETQYVAARDAARSAGVAP